MTSQYGRALKYPKAPGVASRYDSAGMFLTKSEVREVTGYLYKKLQRRELARMGINFLLNSRFGNPLVLRKELEERACSGSKVREPSIDLGALKEMSNG